MRIQVLIVSLFLLLAAYTYMPAQSTQKEEAITLFKEGKYSEALPKFRRMLMLFPKDPLYHYYVGCCMVQLRADMPRAIEYLKLASEKAVPVDVYFFLGRANHYLYRYDQALEAYFLFKEKANRADKDRLQCDMYIGMAENGKKAMGKQTRLSILKVDTLPSSDLFSLYNRHLKNGQFEEKKEKGLSFFDSKTSSNWWFVPADGDADRAIYLATSGTSRYNHDLAVMRKTSIGDWSRPENLGTVINSPYDEGYAYFNAGEQTLYFSSKGHSSIGGYDIFQSKYNATTHQWSEPVSLGFPINTPYDDYLFVPCDDQTQVSFASNRSTTGDKVLVYTLAFVKEFAKSDMPAKADYTLLSRLVVNTKVPPVLSKTVPVHAPATHLAAETTAVTVRAPVLQKPPVATKPVSVKKDSTPYTSQLVNHKDYNNLLNLALQFQLQSDSLNREADDLRQRASTARSETEKERMNKDAYSLEKRSKATQLKADEFYAKARKYELMFTAKKDSAVKITDDMMRNALVAKGKDGKPSAVEPKSNPADAKKKGKKVVILPNKVVYEFRIMAKSPYATPTDIPLNKLLPEGLIYRIQMGAFSKPVVPDRFRGIVPISGDTVPNSPMIKYYAGLFSLQADGEKALNKVREYGYKDAYLVAFFSGKTIPINRAREIEKDNP